MNERIESARRAYVRAIGVTDPFRLRFWDSRNVTMTQLRVMHLVRERCEPSTGELAEQLHIRPATLTGLADRLEAKGFIRRWPDASDRRVVRVGLTAEGTQLLQEAYAAAHAYLDSIFARMGSEALEEFAAAMTAFSDTAESVLTPEPVSEAVEAVATDDP